MITMFFDLFTNDATKRACADEVTMSFTARKAAATTAANACL
jgi:hypothetical protein